MRRNLLTVPIFLFAAFLTHAAVADTGILNPKTSWKVKTGGPIRGGSVTDLEKIYFGSSDGNLYAVNKDTGVVEWQFHTGGSISNTPAISGSVVFTSSNDNFVYALDRNSGKQVWKFQLQPAMNSYWEWDYFTASPVVSDGKVYIGSGDGNLYVLTATDGQLLWKFKTNGRIRTAPLIAYDVVYVASNDGVVYALTAGSGKLTWKFETDGAKMDSRKFGWDRNSIYASPVIQDSLLVVASRDGKTYAVNVNTHKQKWSFTYGPTWAMSVVVEKGIVFTGWSDNSLVSAVDLFTGQEKWKFQCGSLVYTKPYLTDREVIIGSADEKVYCIHKGSGEKKWEYKTGGSVYSSPLVDNNTVFTGSDDGYFYALTEGIKPRKAVYHPIPKQTAYEHAFVVDKKITPYLKDKGFEQLDSAKLYHFLSDRIRDHDPSVIVFAYEYIPANIVGDDPATGMIRKYLEAGGKILWFGNTPNLYSFDDKGVPHMDLTIAARMLGIETIRPEESGNYYCKATQTGLNWGLPAWSTLTYATVSPKNVTPLAYDEYGRITAWLRKFNPRPGSGFISCRTWGWYAPIHEDDLEMMHGLAVHELE